MSGQRPRGRFDAGMRFGVRSPTMHVAVLGKPFAWGIVLWVVAVLTLLCWPSRALAQPAAGGGGAGGGAAGEVTRIGFNGIYEPTSWIPMKVRVQPPDGESGAYLLRVHARDLDGDRVIYERTIALTGGVGPQEFWTYFKREPSPGEFVPSEELRVVLADPEGRELAQLSLQSQRQLLSVDADAGNSPARRLVLLVSEPAGGRYPGNSELTPSGIVGLTEITAGAALLPTDLPDRTIGYDGVHTVVWQDADPAVLIEGGGERMAALREWVRNGGRLVITHRGDWQSLEPIFDLLPVTPLGVAEKDDLVPLRNLALTQAASANGIDAEAFETAPGPFRYVMAVPKEGAIVERWLEPEDFPEAAAAEMAELTPTGRAPFLARMPYGFGSVTWLGIDLGNPNVTGPPNRPTRGWTAIWAALLDVGDRPTLDPDDAAENRFETVALRDLGVGPISGTRLAGKSVALVTLALVFFIGYWLLAGPGLYFYLATRKKTHLSWFAFGAAAALATLLTMGLTRLVLRGAPELRHVSVERAGPVADPLVLADMGLYIPRDGVQVISVDEASVPPSLTAFVPPSDPLGTSGRTNPITYIVPLDAPSADAAEDLEGSAAIVEIPYRSTLKKLEASWSGERKLGIEGSPRLIADSYFPAGALVNTSGYDLRNVHIAYKVIRGGRAQVVVLYLPTWANGQSLASLQAVFDPEGGERARFVGTSARTGQAPPREEPVWGFLDTYWAPNYWYNASGLRRQQLSVGGELGFDDWNNRYRQTPAMLSLFSLLPPMENVAGANTASAVSLLRRGAREWDISAAVSAGQLVVIGEAIDVPVPLPLKVNGRSVEGQGTVIAQYVLPLDRTAEAEAERQRYLEQREQVAAAEAAATQPSR